MVETNIGLGMYTVFESAQKDMTNSFVQLAQMGYTGMEFYGEPADFPADRVIHALQESGLALTGWHIEWRNLQEKTFGPTVEYLHKVGCPMAIIPCLGGKWNVGHDSSEECKDRWLYYIEDLNHIYEKLQKEGLGMGYHNHEHEFQLHYDGQTVFDLLYENFAPGIVMEFDSGNCIEGGANPLEVLRKHAERPKILHLKPYSKKEGFDVVLGSEQDDNNWKEILKDSGADFKWLLIESEDRALPEMTNAKLCMEGLRRFL